MRIVDVRGTKPGTLGIIYCGRNWAGWKESELQNYHPSKRVCPWCRVKHTKQEAIAAYKKDLGEMLVLSHKEGTAQHTIIEILKSIPDDAVLGCWCTTKDEKDMIRGSEECHCEIIIRAVRWLKWQAKKEKEIKS